MRHANMAMHKGKDEDTNADYGYGYEGNEYNGH
jgi:hypothetical protein